MTTDPSPTADEPHADDASQVGLSARQTVARTGQTNGDGKSQSTTEQKSITKHFDAEGYTNPSKDAVSDAIGSYLSDLIDAIEAIELEARAKGAQKREVTASTVIEADRKLRFRTLRQKKSTTDKAYAILSPLSGVAAGLCGSYMFDNTAWAVAFGLSAATAVWTTIKTYGNDKS